jgi:hypothetical protein
VPTLTCRRVMYFSEGDELLFFSWLDKIKVIRRWEGKGDCILLYVSSRMSDTGLRELLAIFHRYKIDMRELAQFQSPSNRDWFTDPRKYWHKKIFRTP